MVLSVDELHVPVGIETPGDFLVLFVRELQEHGSLRIGGRQADPPVPLADFNREITLFPEGILAVHHHPIFQLVLLRNELRPEFAAGDVHMERAHILFVQAPGFQAGENVMVVLLHHRGERRDLLDEGVQVNLELPGLGQLQRFELRPGAPAPQKEQQTGKDGRPQQARHSMT